MALRGMEPQLQAESKAGVHSHLDVGLIIACIQLC